MVVEQPDEAMAALPVLSPFMALGGDASIEGASVGLALGASGSEGMLPLSLPGMGGSVMPGSVVGVDMGSSAKGGSSGFVEGGSSCMAGGSSLIGGSTGAGSSLSRTRKH